MVSSSNAHVALLTMISLGIAFQIVSDGYYEQRRIVYPGRRGETEPTAPAIFVPYFFFPMTSPAASDYANLVAGLAKSSPHALEKLFDDAVLQVLRLIFEAAAKSADSLLEISL